MAMKNIKILSTDLNEVTKTTKEFIIFQKIIMKPLMVGFFLSAFLTATRLHHTSFCNSLNSIFSPNLIIFTSYAAIFFHILSPWCKISRTVSESIYEVAAQVTSFLISGMIAALIIMNLQESAVTWSELLLLTSTTVLGLFLMLSAITTFPYFLLLNKPITGITSKQKILNLKMLYLFAFFAGITFFYISEPTGLKEHEFCKETCKEVQEP